METIKQLNGTDKYYSIYSKGIGYCSKSLGIIECWGLETRINASDPQDALDKYKTYFPKDYQDSIDQGKELFVAILTSDEDEFVSDKIVVDDEVGDLIRKGIAGYITTSEDLEESEESEESEDSEESEESEDSEESDSKAFNTFIDNRVSGFYRADNAGCNSSWDYEELEEYLTDIVEPEVHTEEDYIFDDPQVNELNEKLCTGKMTWVDFVRQYCPIAGEGAMFIAEYLDENGY